MTPAKQLITVADKMFKKQWEHRRQNQESRTETLVTQQRHIERKINQLLDKVTEVESDTVLARFEQRIKSLEDEKIVVEEKIAIVALR